MNAFSFLEDDTLVGGALLLLALCGFVLAAIAWRFAGHQLELERRRAELERCRWGVNEHSLD